MLIDSLGCKFKAKLLKLSKWKGKRLLKSAIHMHKWNLEKEKENEIGKMRQWKQSTATTEIT